MEKYKILLDPTIKQLVKLLKYLYISLNVKELQWIEQYVQL